MNGSNEESTSPTRSSRDVSGYELIYPEQFFRDIATLPLDVRRRAIEKLEHARDNPFHYFERLTGLPEYKLRVGDYRIIVAIEGKRIMVSTIGHRKNIYD